MPAAVFDLNGTFLDPSALAEPLGGSPEDQVLVEQALDVAISTGMALTLTGSYRPFKELVQAGLERALLVAGRDPSVAEEAVGRSQQMPPFPEAEAALDRLEQAGFRLAVMTNSATEGAQTALENAGLRDRFELVLGTDEVEAFKPHPRVYGTVTDRLAIAPTETWLVAVHWWDVVGAAAAGWRTAWVARKEQVLLPAVDADVEGADLLEAADRIVASAGR